MAARPYTSRAPTSFDPSVPLPLVVMLHGYSASGAIEESYLRLGSLVDSQQFFYATPDGTLDGSANRFWNATAACCNFYGSTVDDVAYLMAVVDDMEARYPIDPKRVFFFGHSNGAFMTQRLACEKADRIAAIVSLAGAQSDDLSLCTPSEAVPMVEVHGTADQTILYAGGDIVGNPYPSATTTVADWAQLDGCGPTATDDGVTLDLDTSLLGLDTDVQRFTGCARGDVELWTINGGQHIPSFGSAFAPAAIDYLLAHPKP